VPANVGTPTGQAFVPVGVNETVPFVPAGVPALTAEVVALDPVKVWAGTVPEDPVKAGTPAGQEIVSAGTVPEFPVKVGAATVPAGVKLAVLFVPAGVIVSLPPVVPTSPFANSVPTSILLLIPLTSTNPVGHACIIIRMVPLGIMAPPLRWPLTTGIRFARRSAARIIVSISFLIAFLSSSAQVEYPRRKSVYL
jgi:hypothetical protein